MSDTDQNGSALSREATGSMDPYGARAMRYVRDHCPTRFATIPDPVGFFTALGSQIRAQVEVTEEAIMAAETVPGEEFTETLGRWKTARLMAEERVFSEMVYQPMPPETLGMDDDRRDESGAYLGGPAGWEPLMPDCSDIWRDEAP
jgi:hypothetical protein